MGKISITVAEKLKIVARAKNGESLHSLERGTGYQRCQIRKWIRNEDKLCITGKEKRRTKGAGRKSAYPELEKAIMIWFRNQRSKKLVVNYNSMRRESLRLAHLQEITDFTCSNKWIRNVCRRNGVSSRKITNQSQDDKGTTQEKYLKSKNHLDNIKIKTAGLSTNQIYNMDETACYFDMSFGRTLHFKGEKTVDGLDTGHSKNRFTVVLCISASGKFVKTMIILKGLKKVPKLKLPKTIEVTVNDSGSMNAQLMLNWVKTCFVRRSNLLVQENSVLLMDSYKAHLKPEVINFLKNKCKTVVLAIPPKTTSYLQPLDVSINHPFKNAMRSAWTEWFSESTPEYTNKGYRKKPTYQNIVDFVDSAIKKISPEIIQRSFECCGIAEYSEEIEEGRLNARLRNVLESGSSIVNLFNDNIEVDEVPDNTEAETASDMENSEMSLDFDAISESCHDENSAASINLFEVSDEDDSEFNGF